MNLTASQQEFWRRMNEWRIRGQISGPEQIAKIAVDSKLSPHEGVLALCDGDSLIGFRPHSEFDALSRSSFGICGSRAVSDF